MIFSSVWFSLHYESYRYSYNTHWFHSNMVANESAHCKQSNLGLSMDSLLTKMKNYSTTRMTRLMFWVFECHGYECMYSEVNRHYFWFRYWHNLGLFVVVSFGHDYVRRIDDWMWIPMVRWSMIPSKNWLVHDCYCFYVQIVDEEWVQSNFVRMDYWYDEE